MKEKRWICVCVLLCLLFCGMAAADGPEMIGEISGTCEGIAYVLPCFEGGSETEEAINLWMNRLAEEGLPEMFPQLFFSENDARVNYFISRNDERYLSVVMEAETEDGTVGRKAVTFAKDGIYAGQVIDLMQVLGLESEIGTDEMNRTIRALIWENVQRDAGNMDRGYLDGLTIEAVTYALNPQWDFRLDENGNIVFVIQPGEIAAEMEGVLEFPFMPEELIDTMK